MKDELENAAIEITHDAWLHICECCGEDPRYVLRIWQHKGVTLVHWRRGESANIHAVT